VETIPLFGIVICVLMVAVFMFRRGTGNYISRRLSKQHFHPAVAALEF
jgi:hypothetical protein